jgi:hypothetical protein
MTKLYFDTEFTGLHQNTTLISIGIVSDTGKAFYAEFTDYDETQVDDWILKNVIHKLKLVGIVLLTKSGAFQRVSDSVKGVYDIEIVEENDVSKNMISSMSDTAFYECTGNTNFVTERLKEWLKTFGECEMYSDVYAWDWILFCQLFGGAMNIPSNIYYIPQDLASTLKCNGIDPDISRIEFSGMENTENHNSLSDALIIKACFEKIESLKI